MYYRHCAMEHPLLICMIALCMACAALGEEPAPAKAAEFPVRNGDVWVMIGDSITGQNLYTAYLEAFVRARYPKLKFATVNAGRLGNDFFGAASCYKKAVAPYKPTLATVCFGINDHATMFPGEQKFVGNPASWPQGMIDLVCGGGARFYLLSAPPLLAPEDYATDGGKFQLTGKSTDVRGVPVGWRSNPVNRAFANRLAELAVNNHVAFVDQMTTLQTVWGQNFGRDRVMAMRNALRPRLETPIEGEKAAELRDALVEALEPFLDERSFGFNAMLAPDKLNLEKRWKALRTARKPNWEEMRVYLRGWATQVDAMNPPCVQLSGGTDSAHPADFTHPNQAGHLHMAAVILKLLDADPLVSEVTIDAPAKKIIDAKKAAVSDVQFVNGTLTFKRLDESLPLPIEPAARSALDVDVITPLGTPKNLFGMSRFMLTVTNMPPGNYEVLIDGYTIGTATADDLAHGFDAGLTRSGPIAAQTVKLLEAVRANTAIAEVLEETAADPVAAPRVFEESQPVEHEWKVRQR
jgi:hypothetical protein